MILIFEDGMPMGELKRLHDMMAVGGESLNSMDMTCPSVLNLFIYGWFYWYQ